MRREGFPICQKCGNGEVVFKQEMRAHAPQLSFLYRCDTCGNKKWLGLVPDNVTIDDRVLKHEN